MKVTFKLLLSITLLSFSKAASDCSIIHKASPRVFNFKCCNKVLYGFYCSNSRVVKIDNSNLTSTSIYYNNLFPILGLLTELTVIRISYFSGIVSLPPDIGRLSKLKILSLSGDELSPILIGSQLPLSLSNCSQLQILQVFHDNSGVWEVLD